MLSTATMGSGRVRSPSEWLSPFLTPFTVLNDMRLRARGWGVSPSADGDQRLRLWTSPAVLSWIS
ncbi:MAG: hypothetical protein K2J73_09275 [Oscillospiraceae bacterium]|nr:hypothetical protein [Oscillospiraceae bacterium]